ncbi:MAG: HisA/HisF-related TIM barrel protein [Mycobacteriales bacterium]
MSRPGFTLLPAVDVVAGRAVRLVQGRVASTVGDGDPLEVALGFERDGASWVHLVDVDAAFGRGSNAGLLSDVVRRLAVTVQLSAGIRDEAGLVAALDTGAARVVLSTSALEDTRWVRTAIARAGDRLAVALDVHEGRLAGRGSPRAGGELLETLAFLDAAGATRYVVTDVSRDGTLAGPNLELLRRVRAATDGALLASGGIGSLTDLKDVADIAGVEGAVIGAALATGAFRLPAALAMVATAG